MKKIDLKRLLNSINDMDPVLIGLAGICLLWFPVAFPSDKTYLDDCAFIGGMACLLSAAGIGIAKDVSNSKARKAKYKKEIQELNARRADFRRMIQNQINRKTK